VCVYACVCEYYLFEVLVGRRWGAHVCEYVVICASHVQAWSLFMLRVCFFFEILSLLLTHLRYLITTPSLLMSQYLLPEQRVSRPQCLRLPFCLLRLSGFSRPCVHVQLGGCGACNGKSTRLSVCAVDARHGA